MSDVVLDDSVPAYKVVENCSPIDNSGDTSAIVPNGSVTPSQSPQKVKLIPFSQFVQSKPGPVNAQKINATTLLSNNQSYTVCADNNVLNVKNENGGQILDESINNTNNHTSEQVSQLSSEQNMHETAFDDAIEMCSIDGIADDIVCDYEESFEMDDADLLNTNILDIPILFADNDEIIENQSDNISMGFEDSQQANVWSVEADSNSVSSVPDSTAVIATDQKSVAITNNNNNNINSKFVVLNHANLHKLKRYNINADSTTPLKHQTTSVTIEKSPNAVKSTTASVQNSLVGRKINFTNLTEFDGTERPIVFNVHDDDNKSTFKNLIKIQSIDQTSTLKVRSNNNFLLKQSDLKQLPVMKPSLLNRNITVKKINIVRQPDAINKQHVVRINGNQHESSVSVSNDELSVEAQ